MIALLSLTTLAIATLFALAAATTFQWLLLHATVHLMRPATANRRPVRADLGRGTAPLARVFAPHR
jgi:hypothetical protein